MSGNRALHIILGCFGYFGFGGGYLTASRRAAGQPYYGEAYCNRCPLKEACWKRHRRRTREVLPALAEVEDALMKTGLRGGRLLEAYRAAIRSQGESSRPGGVEEMPPAIALNLANMEAGLAAGAGQAPQRREVDPPWPLVPLEPLPEGEEP